MRPSGGSAWTMQLDCGELGGFSRRFAASQPSGGTASLRLLAAFGGPARDHEERDHQGKDSVILFPAAADRIGSSSGKFQIRGRLGGLLKFDHRAAA